MTIGGMNIAEQIIKNTISIGILQRGLEQQSRTGRPPTQQDAKRFQDEVVAELNSRYPELGLQV